MLKQLVSPMVLTFLLVGCGGDDRAVAINEKQKIADAIYTNARIYTVNEKQPWAEAIAVAKGKIIGVGSSEAMLSYTGPQTERYDVGGKLIIPGIHDTHNHAIDAGLNALYACRFLSNDLAVVLEIISGCVANKEAGQWVTGGQWTDALFAEDIAPKTLLDGISTTHPILLMDWSTHNAWVNSKALDMLGITKETTDPKGGVIVRDSVTGEATGILLDNAAYNARNTIPRYSQEQYAEAIKWGIEKMLGYGVTTYKDALVTEDTLPAYIALDQQGALKNRVKASLSWRSAQAVSHEAEIELINSRPLAASDYLDASFAKIMLDGIPPTYTAALIEPYMPSEQFGDNHRGKLMMAPDQLKQDMINLDGQGITVKLHATGDRAVRVALDAIEAARKINGDSGLIHEISHAELIHADDLNRFQALNVAAEMCPILWYPAALGDLRPIMGEGRHRFWQINTVGQSGALVIYGSDWPVIPEPNPWPGIESMVTRKDPSGQDPQPGWDEEAVDLETAVRIFTLNGAIANKDADASGSLEPGKAADFIVLDRDIFAVPIEQVSETQVQLTVIAGQQRHGSLAAERPQR